jgi:DNA-directed RNA polymerase specialized sigma24 family protein
MTAEAAAMSRDRIAAIYAEAGFLASIRSAIRKARVPKQDCQEVLQETFAIALASTSLPADDTALRQYVVGIARNQAKMHRRKERGGTQSFDEEQHVGESPADATEAAETRAFLERIAAQIPENRWSTFVWLVRMASSESLQDIAREEGITYAAAHSRVDRLREDIARWSVNMAVLATVLVAVITSWSILGPDFDDGRVGAAAPSITPAPPRETHRPTAADRFHAAELRRHAEDACAEQRWDDCRADLDEATSVDPSSESDPLATRLRQELAPHGR